MRAIRARYNPYL
jgi:elongator complex protein 3